MKIYVVLFVSLVFLSAFPSLEAFVSKDPKPKRPFSQFLHRKNHNSAFLSNDGCCKPWVANKLRNDSLGKKELDGFLRDFSVIQWIFAIATVLSISPLAAWAVSGGGLDFAGTDISGQDFSNGNYKGKDFTQVIAKTTNFAGSNLQGCRFYKAYLVRADFSGSDLRGASLEDTSMDEATLKNAIVAGAYFSNSIVDTKDLGNVDFSDAQVPMKTLPLLCERDDVKGTNPVTGADTRESLMCP